MSGRQDAALLGQLLAFGLWDVRAKLARLSSARRTDYERETTTIRESSKRPEAKKRHKFRKSKWTHPNGHPRCGLCGREEELGGYCRGSAEDHQRGQKSFDAEMRRDWIQKTRPQQMRSGSSIRRRLGSGFWAHIRERDGAYGYTPPPGDPVWRHSAAAAKVASTAAARLFRAGRPATGSATS